MSFVPKPNDKVRSVVDLVQLNKYVDRPTHLFPASKDIVSRIPTGLKCFAVFDCTHGYWQIPLEEESRPYTCFMTEWGCYQYKLVPMGLMSSGDEFCAQTKRAFADITGLYELVDDILIYGENHAQLLHRIRLAFQRCSEWGITLSRKKYLFGPVVQFAGYIVNEKGTKMNPELVAANAKFPAPKDITNLRSLIGLVNRFNDQNPDLKHPMVTWQGVLKKCNKYKWGDVHESTLNKVKEIITNPVGPILKHFNSRLPIQLLTDASRSGIGFCLVQIEAGNKVRFLIMAGTRFLSPAKKNYAVVELELWQLNGQWRNVNSTSLEQTSRS